MTIVWSNRSAMILGLALLVSGAGGCGGAGSGRVGGDSARGAPPDNHDTLTTLPDSHPSAAADTVPLPSRVIVHEVNTGAHGMAAQVRWTLSPDERAILVVEDPVGVEAEPVPDGFLFGNERTGAVVQLDGVWDVAPSPDWSRLAWGRAFVFRSGESETIPAREWERFFGWLPEDVAAPTTDAMRRRAEPFTFPASGMSYARAMGLAQVLEVGSLAAGKVAVIEAPTLRLEGWRVRWNASGDSVAVGSAPQTVQDDARATRWTLVAARGGTSWRESLPPMGASAGLVELRWTEGPVIDVSIEIDMNAGRRAKSTGTIVTSANGRIAAVRGGHTIPVGPGAVLAATRDGRFIAALAPNAAAKEYDHKVRVVVYELVP